MMNHRRALVLSPVAFAALAFLSCDSDESDVFREQLVVQGTMYVDQPMSIDLARSVAWDSYYDPDAVRVSGAEVTVFINDVEYLLTEQNSGVDGTYLADATAPVVTTGETYALRAVYEGDTIRATTTAVAPLDFDSTNIVPQIPSDSVAVDTFEYGERIGTSLRLPFFRWTADPVNLGYAFLIENLEPDWHDEDRELGEDNGPCTGSVTAWVLSEQDSLSLPPISVCATGLHRVRVYSCDQPLWDYFHSAYLGEIENYPVSNLSHGLGVFCAVGVDTAYFYLTDDIED